MRHGISPHSSVSIGPNNFGIAVYSGGVPLSYANTASLNIGIQTDDGQPITVHWGDGTSQAINSTDLIGGVTTMTTKNFAVAQAGLIRIETPERIIGLRSTVGTWNFDLSILSKSIDLDYLMLASNNFAITGDLSDVSHLTYQLYLQGSSMVITGDISVVKGITFWLRLNGVLFNMTYTTTAWPSIPSSQLLISLSAGQLTEVEVDKMFIDLDAEGSAGTGTLNLAGSNAAPTVDSLAARTALAANGWTIVTN